MLHYHQACVFPQEWKIARVSPTHEKISQLVKSLQTSCQQAAFALLVPSCQQVVPNLLTTCNKLDENIRLVTRLF